MKADTPERSLSPAASALAAGICVLWGANTVAIKFSLEGFGPFTAAAVRFGISLALLWAWAAASDSASVALNAAACSSRRSPTRRSACAFSAGSAPSICRKAS